jgi:thioredoxin-related protein
MINYKILTSSLKNDDINDKYRELLENKYNFLILLNNNCYYCLTKEKTIFPLKDYKKFIMETNKDVFFFNKNH